MHIELLIALIKERSVLYDLRNPLFKDKRERDRKWREICTAMDVTIDIAKTRWKSLKDCYKKHLKSRTTTGQSSIKYLHWQWAKHMEFMNPHLKLPPVIIKIEPQPHYETADLGTQLTHSSSDVQGNQSSSNVLGKGNKSSSNVFGAHGISPGVTQRRRRRAVLASTDKKASPSADRIIQYIENMKKDGHDATELIFLGYAKSIKSFSIPRQARIKMNIAKMIMEEEVAHFEETIASSSKFDTSDSTQPNAYSPVNSTT